MTLGAALRRRCEPGRDWPLLEVERLERAGAVGRGTKPRLPGDRPWIPTWAQIERRLHFPNEADAALLSRRFMNIKSSQRA
jgi:hypothetical protein